MGVGALRFLTNCIHVGGVQNEDENGNNLVIFGLLNNPPWWGIS